MKIPGAERAVVDPAKLVEYCLNPFHPRGRHKARVFSDRLGIDVGKVDSLKSALLRSVQSNDAVPGEVDCFGSRFVIEFPMNGPRGTVRVRSAWIVRSHEDFPRLTSCFVVNREVE